MNPSHAQHDELLIVRAASVEVDPAEASAAERQLASCEDCRAIHADVQAIRASTVASVLRVPPRPRSFRVPADELERLRIPAWQRWLGRLGSPRFDLLRPLATAVAGLGLVVMVLGSAGLGGGPAALEFSQGPTAVPAAQPLPTAAATNREGNQDSSAHAPGGTSAPALGSGSAGGEVASPATQPPDPYQQRSVERTVTSEPSGVPGTVVGMILVAGGAVLLLLQTAARRAIGR